MSEIDSEKDEFVLEKILENIPYFVFWKDRDSRYLGCNLLFAKAAGFEKSSDLIGKTDYECVWTKEESDFFVKIDKEVMDKGENILNIEEPQLQADGKTKTLLTSKVPLFDSQGRVNGLLGIFTDITDRKLLESEKEHALHELHKTMDQLVAQEKLASLGALSAGIAHEIRNPLNLIHNSTEVITDSINDGLKKIVDKVKDSHPELLEELNEEFEIVESMAEILTENTERLEGIVDSMMKQAGGDTVDLEFLDLNELIEKQVNLSYQSMRATNPFQCVPLIELAPLDGTFVNYQTFARVVSNLVRNSFQALEEKSQTLGDSFTPALSVSSMVSHGELVISFKDNGPGIPQELLGKVLEPFFTTKPAGVGTGLGLSMVNDIIVNLHNGKFFINSQLGEGTEVLIHLPVIPK